MCSPARPTRSHIITASGHTCIVQRYPLHAGFIVSVHRMSMENRPVDPDNIQRGHRPISFMRMKYITRANDLPKILCNYFVY